MSLSHFTIDERSRLVRSSKMAFGRKPTWVSGPDQKGTMVLHVTGSLFYLEGGGNEYRPSRFLVLTVREVGRTVEGLVDYEVASIIAEIAGIPKKPSKRRGGGV